MLPSCSNFLPSLNRIKDDEKAKMVEVSGKNNKIQKIKIAKSSKSVTFLTVEHQQMNADIRTYL